MAYMETEVEGVLREVVVMLLSGGSANTLSDVIQAISLNDANTGELVACYPFPVADHRAEFDPLPVVSELGRFFITASTEQGELGLAPHTTIWSDGPGVGPRVLKGYQSSDVTTIFLNGHRELVAVVDESLVGLSIENGEPYWIQQTTGDRPVNGIARPGRTAQTLWTSAETHLFLRTYDQCGVPTGEEVVGWTVLPIWNANVIRTEAGGTVVMVDGVETVSEACYNHIQVNDNLVTCFASKKDGFSLVSFDLAGTWRSEFPLTSQVINLEFGRGLVAGPDNTVIFSVRDPDLRFHTMAVDVVTNEVKWTLTFQDDEARYSKGILTPRGVLIMSRGAIQTDVFGLAPTYYPRGWVGGNENRGYVALPE